MSNVFRSSRRLYGVLVSCIILAAAASVPSFAQSSGGSTPVEIVPAAGHTGAVQKVAYSYDGKWIASASFDDTIKLWHAETGTLIRTFSHGPWALAFTRDGLGLLTADRNTIRLWDIRTGAVVREFNAKGQVYSIATSPDGLQFVSGGSEAIIFWRLGSTHPLRVVNLDSYEIMQIAYSPDGKLIASASQDNNFRAPIVNLWDAFTGRRIRGLGATMHGASAVSFSSDGTLLAASVADNKYEFAVRVWNTATGNLVAVPGPRLTRMDFVTFLHDNNTVALHNPATGIELWDVSRGIAIKTIKGEAASSLAISPTAGVLVGGGNRLSVWDIRSGRATVTFPGAPNGVSSIALSPDAGTLALQTVRGQLSLWSTENGRLLRVLRKIGEGGSGKVAFSTDGNTLIEEFHSVLMGPDRPHPGKGKVTLWDNNTGQVIQTHDGIGAPAISWNGALIAAGAHETSDLLVWNNTSKRPIRRMKGHSSIIRAAAFSSDSRTIVTASEDDTAIVWDVSTGRTIRSIQLGAFHEREVGPPTGAVAISSDALLVASGNRDGTVNLIETGTGRQLWTYQGSKGGVTAVVFSPKNSQIIAIFAEGVRHQHP